MAATQAYKTKIEIAFVGSSYIKMESNKIVYMLIEHMYEKREMPIIYVSLSIESDLYSTLINEKDSAKIYLRIQKFDAYSETSLCKDYIKGQFTYFLPSITPEYSKDLSDYNSNVDSAFKIVTIGLMDMTIVNTLRKTFGGSGSLKNIDQHSLVYSAVEDTKIIMKTPIYNAKYDDIYIPPMTSRKAMLDFIFAKDPFYDTEFLYFIDFNTSYLLDKSGQAISGNDGQYNDIIFDIKAVTSREAYNEGMEIKNGSYYFYINPANANVSSNNGAEKIANQLVIGNETKTSIMDLNINNNVDSTTKQTFRRMDESGAIVYKNSVESSQLCLELVKENVDASFITPNKTITVNNYEGYSEYNGKYILLYKKEVIRGAAGEFISAVTVGIKKLGNVQKIGKVTSPSAKGKVQTKTTSSTAKGDNYSSRTTKVSPSKKASRTSSRR